MVILIDPGQGIAVNVPCADPTIILRCRVEPPVRSKRKIADPADIKIGRSRDRGGQGKGARHHGKIAQTCGVAGLRLWQTLASYLRFRSSFQHLVCAFLPSQLGQLGVR